MQQLRSLDWLIVPLLALSPGLGCARVTTAGHPLGPPQLQKLREQVDGRLAEVHLRPPPGTEAVFRPQIAGRVHIEEAMVRVVADNEIVHRRPLVDVQEIDANHAGTGVLFGAIGGGLLGAGIGALFGSSLGRDCSPRPGVDITSDCHSWQDAAADGAVIGLLPGLLVGGVVGALVGAGPVWRFSSPPVTTTAALVEAP